VPKKKEPSKIFLHKERNSNTTKHKVYTISNFTFVLFGDQIRLAAECLRSRGHEVTREETTWESKAYVEGQYLHQKKKFIRIDDSEWIQLAQTVEPAEQ
jgi:hypothetical protein